MVGDERATPVAFFLTRKAAIDLRNIHARSCREWGEATADCYLADLYASMRQATIHPEGGRLRQHRSSPFLMIPARQHFVIYDIVPEGIAVLTIQHQMRDIESLITELTPAFHAEIERLKRKI
ncbi:MAG: type II toxin-antitoxin system RelE/ParE family toxin [Azoarcus sp.]|jgi:plasmid stabilization system protein ParE|nr:type II toxin-antitoxin system RelE/ParE family toxin [Azoarcus sp.]